VHLENMTLNSDSKDDPDYNVESDDSHSSSDESVEERQNHN
jgi:hypothetical protein